MITISILKNSNQYLLLPLYSDNTHKPALQHDEDISYIQPINLAYFHSSLLEGGKKRYFACVNAQVELLSPVNHGAAITTGTSLASINE